MRRPWILLALVLACSRENPAFLLAGAGASEPTTGPAATSGTTDAPTTTTTTTTTTSTDPGTTTGKEPLPTCPVWDEPGLDWQFTYKGEPLAPAVDCPKQSFRGVGMLAPTSVQLSPDSGDLNCGATIDGVLDFSVGAFKFPPFLQTCLQIDVAWSSDCSAVDRALLWYYNPDFPGVKLLLAVGVVGSLSAHPDTPPALSPTLQIADACSCGGDMKECCVAGDLPGPGGYRLLFADADVEVEPGAATPTDAPILADGGKFTVTNRRTHVHADCVDNQLHVDWYALRQ